MSILSQLFSNYGDDVVRNTASQHGDDILRVAANQADDAARATTKLFRGQVNGIDDFYYNSYTDPSEIGQYVTKTIGDGYFMTPKRDAATAFGTPLEIDVPTNRIMSREQLDQVISDATQQVNDSKIMKKLWRSNPDYAEYLEAAADNQLPAIAKYHNMPFIENNTKNGQDLAEILFYRNVDPDLTKSLLAQLTKNNLI